MGNFLSRVGFLLAFCLAFSLSPAVIAQQSDLAVSIKAVENGVEFTLTNNSDAPISLLRWETPLESELTQDVFVVIESDGGNKSVHSRPATFSGRLFKRPDPIPADFIEIEARESVAAVVNLADYYQLTSEGIHQVSFQGEFQVQGQAQSLAQSLAQVRSGDRSVLSHNHHHQYEGLDSIFVSTDPVSVDLAPVPEILYARPAGYSGCTASQLAELPLDFDASEIITSKAREALEVLPENERAASPRYLQWFGAYDSNRYASVLDTYTKSEALMRNGEVEFICDCDEPYFAFIRRTEPFKVNLCTYYWSAQRTGTDSRAGTILHEVSHFNEIGGTSDHAYGAADVSDLADNNPVRAVNNADSIEYFAENTPYLEISAGVAAPQETVTYPILTLGVEQTGSVFENRSNYYQVAGADQIRLTTLSGDADLYVYSDDTFSNILCSSSNVSALDSCDVSTAANVYIDVFGYEGSTYRIAAVVDVDSLQVGQMQTSSIANSEWQYYAITGASFLQVESLSGDADLYVYSSPDRAAENLICDSRNTSSYSTSDSCDVSGTVYVGVYGIIQGRYSIAALTNNPNIPEPPEVVDSVPVDTADSTPVDEVDPAPVDEVDPTPVDPVDPDPVDPVDPVVSTQTLGSSSSSGGGVFGPAMLSLFLLPLVSRMRSRRFTGSQG